MKATYPINVYIEQGAMGQGETGALNQWGNTPLF